MDVAPILINVYFGWILIFMVMSFVLLALTDNTAKASPDDVNSSLVNTIPAAPVVEYDAGEDLRRARGRAKAESQRIRRQIEDRGSPATDEERLKLRELGSLSRKMAAKLREIEQGALNPPDANRPQ